MTLTVTWPQSAQRGAGVHRINPRILETDEVRDAVVRLRRNTVLEHAASGRSKGEVWDIFKLRLFRLLKSYSIRDRRAEKARVAMAMRVVKIFEAKMSLTAPSAYKIDKLEELKLDA